MLLDEQLNRSQTYNYLIALEIEMSQSLMSHERRREDRELVSREEERLKLREIAEALRKSGEPIRRQIGTLERRKTSSKLLRKRS
jgi:hypothetical protein